MALPIYLWAEYCFYTHDNANNDITKDTYTSQFWLLGITNHQYENSCFYSGILRTGQCIPRWEGPVCYVDTCNASRIHPVVPYM